MNNLPSVGRVRGLWACFCWLYKRIMRILVWWLELMLGEQLWHSSLMLEDFKFSLPTCFRPRAIFIQLNRLEQSPSTSTLTHPPPSNSGSILPPTIC